jgi:hypothetical protein
LTDDVKRETLDPRTLPEDIFRLLSDAEGHEVSEENVEWAGKVFMDLLRSRLKKREEKKGEEVLRFSSLGKKDRQIWYDANMPEASEQLPGKMHFKFLYGDVLELLMLFLAKETGHEVTHEQHEVDVDGVKGHMDAVIDGVPVDCKSASSFSYQKFANGGFVFDDPFGYIQQLSGYAHAIGKTDRAGFLVCDKTHGDICFAEIDALTIEGNPPQDRIEELRRILHSPEPPARCYEAEPEGKSGNLKLGIGCSYCPKKYECWKDANNGKGLRKFVYSRGPVWLTKIKKEPRVDEAS